MDLGDTLSAAEAAERLDVPEEALPDLVADGLLAAPALGRYRAQDISRAKRQITQACWQALRDLRRDPASD